MELTVVSEIKVIRQVSSNWLNQEGILQWPLFEESDGSFPCYYYTDESCYVLEGEVLVTISGDDEITLCTGDFITLPKDRASFWEVLKPFRGHFSTIPD